MKKLSTVLTKTHFMFLLMAMVIVPMLISPISVSAASYEDSTTIAEVSTRGRIILTSDSFVDKDGTYSKTFTTRDPDTMDHGMSYYLVCNTNITFRIVIKSTSKQVVYDGNLSINDPYGTLNFPADANTTYTMTITPSNQEINYDLAYNIYYTDL